MEGKLIRVFFLSQARAGIISTVEVLKVMEAFVNEPNYTVWSDLSCNLEILSTLLSHTDFYEEIQVFVKDVFSPIGERLGWDPKPGEGKRTHRWVLKQTSHQNVGKWQRREEEEGLRKCLYV